MDINISLKEMERKAFRSTFQDGLWDIYFGMIVIAMAFFIFRPEGGYNYNNVVAFVLGFGLANLVFWGGKKLITIPRMGQVTFGPTRQRRSIKLAIIMGGVVLIQTIFVAVQFLGWLSPAFGQALGNVIKSQDMELLLVASIAAFFIEPGMILVAFIIDFPRGYYIAILMALAVFLMVYQNQPLFPVLLGTAIIIPGIVFLVRFLKKYPRHQEG